MDSIETKFGVRAEEMEADQLLSYFELSLGSVLGIKVNRASAASRAIKIFQSFQDRYGKVAAGKIVRWAVYEAKGKAPNGSILTPSSFVESNSWITDTFYAELQIKEKEVERELLKRERSRVLKSGFLHLEDL